MILDTFPAVLWINLDRSLYRRKYMENLLAAHHLSHRRITAIDGTLANAEYDTDCLPENSLSNVENACTCSHLKALRYFVHHMTDETVIIFEDDVAFDFLPYIKNDWSQFMVDLPHSFGMVQLAVSSEDKIDIHLTKLGSKSNRYGTTAYLISRKRAIQLLEAYVVNNKYQLTNLGKNALADKLLYSLGPVYSIPIFSYRCLSSTIHPSHLQMHKKSKVSQLLQWKLKYVQKTA